jgi:hypothetical protein
MKDHEREVSKYQTLLDTKDKVFNELQRKVDEQNNNLKSVVCIFLFKNN